MSLSIRETLPEEPAAAPVVEEPVVEEAAAEEMPMSFGEEDAGFTVGEALGNLSFEEEKE